MNFGRAFGYTAILAGVLGATIVVTAPGAFAASGSRDEVRLVDFQHVRLADDDPPRGDYARGYDDGRQQGVTDGTHDADVDCAQHQRVTNRAGGDYQNGWENGYKVGYEFGYTRTYAQKCQAGGQR